LDTHTHIAPAIASLLPVLSVEDTSVLVAHLPRLKARLALLDSSFPEGTRHSIAIKTNPHPGMLRTLVEWGYGLEAASIEEVERALEAGCPVNRIVFDSPVKTRREIAQVVDQKDLLVNVNSLGELDRYPSKVACCLGIRINPQVHTGAPEMFDVSKNESKFGVAITDREAIVKAALSYPVRALHMHSGSQMKDLEQQRGALITLRELALEINAQTPGKIEVLDIGGGLPSEPLSDDTRMAEYGRIVQEVFGATDFELVTEFGQWVHAEAGFAVSQIEYRVDPGRLFIHLGADFFMRDAYTKARSFPLLAFSKSAQMLSGEEIAFDLAGPLCFAGDYLAQGAHLPASIAEGDWLVVDHTGANTYALWSRHCSRTVPAMFAWDGKNVVRWSDRKRIDF